MGRIIVPQYWTEQPDYPVQVNWGHPLAARLLCFGYIVKGRLYFQSRGNLQGQLFGVATPSVDAMGASLSFNGTSDTLTLNSSSGAPFAISATQLTMIAAIKAGAVAAGRTMLSSSNAGAGGAQFRLNSTGISLVAESVSELMNITGQVAAGEVCILGATYDGSIARAFKNGRLVGAGASNPQTLNHQACSIGSHNLGAGEFFDGHINAFLTLYGSDQQEASELTANPWQLLQPIKKRTFASLTGIAFDAAGNSGDIVASNTYSGSVAWNGSNRMLSIDVPMLGPGDSVTSMTYGGAPCTFIGSRATVTSLGGVECWRIIQADDGAPPAGSNTLTVTLNTSIEFVVAWVSYKNVDQNTPVESFNSAQATNVGVANDATVSITPVTDKCWVHGAVVANDTSITANQTSRSNVSGTLGSGANEDNNGPVSPAASTTMSYSGMGITTTWAIAGYAIRPFAGPALFNLLGQMCL